MTTTTTAGRGSTEDARFFHDTYAVRKKVFKLLGGAFHVYDGAGNLVMYSKQKAFKLKEDIRLYTDETMGTELLSIAARSVIDFGASYDVIDSQRRQKVGALRRKGLKSLLRDEWMILDANDREIGKVIEDSMAAAVVRRVVEDLAMFLPQKFHAEVGGGTVCTFQQNFNPFVKRLNVDFTHDRGRQFDRRLGLATAVLLSAIEGRQ